MSDGYTKAVLTIIALCLVAIAVEQGLLSQVSAQNGPTPVIIVDEQGRTVAMSGRAKQGLDGREHPVLAAEPPNP
jgi:hypothetical protein